MFNYIANTKVFACRIPEWIPVLVTLHAFCCVYLFELCQCVVCCRQPPLTNQVVLLLQQTAEPKQQTTQLWNLTGTHLANERKSFGSTSYAQGSLIPGSNYSAQDDHAGVEVPGL
mmetsp:Transcript_52906/g.106029  ORF Transcript_52906/g.106029 Transcript_52906/m.106029 type:complete len:115 (+) Transcript_52906:32-376(+)